MARTEVHRRSMGMLSSGHMLTDMNQGAVPALLPFMISQRGFSYMAASGLVLAMTVCSSVVQPIFGHYSDRLSLPWLMPAGIFCGGLGVALAGPAPTYALTFAAIVVSGIGIAAFHPEGSRFANYVSGPQRARGMSFFTVGGNLGVALGPILATPLVLAFGLDGTLALAIPTTLMALVLAAELPRLRDFHPDLVDGRVERRSNEPEHWSAFVRLGTVISLRSLVYFGLVTFVPLYLIGELGSSKGSANAALALLLLGGAGGTLAGGRLADRFGRAPVLIGSLASIPPLMVLFLAGGKVVATLTAGLLGAVLIATFSVTIVMGQEYLPGRIGFASGVTLGLSIGAGGFGAPVLGAIADAHGLRTTMEVIAALAVPAAVLALTLRRAPRPATAARPAPEGAPRSTPA